jgi:cytoskeletal protein CcmA (bactofilin family)
MHNNISMESMMFSKETQKLKSFLGVESEFQGELMVKGILRVDGMVTGKVQADQVIVSESAVIKGDIMAVKILVSGKVEGELRASDILEIGSRGKVKGEIRTKKFLVMEGGEFNGHIEMGADESIILDFKSKNQNATQSIG